MKLQDLRLAEQLRKDKRSLAETAVTSYLNNAGLKTRYDFEKQEVTVLLGQHADAARIKINCIIKDLRDAGYAVSDPKNTKVDGADAVAFTTIEDEPVPTGQEDVKPEHFDKAAGMIKGGKNYSTESRLLTLEALSYTVPADAKVAIDALLVKAEAALAIGHAQDTSVYIGRIEAILAKPGVLPQLEDGSDAAPAGAGPDDATGEDDDESQGAPPAGDEEMEEAFVAWTDGKTECAGRVCQYVEATDMALVERVVNGEFSRVELKADRLRMIESDEAFKAAFRNRRRKFNILF